MCGCRERCRTTPQPGRRSRAGSLAGERSGDSTVDVVLPGTITWVAYANAGHEGSAALLSPTMAAASR